MKHIVLILAIAISCLPARASDHRESLTRLVDPFIGTGAINGDLSGNCYPGATCPFGMVQLSPDTDREPDWNDACGYDYNRNVIYGFSHTHLSGTGAADLIDISLMPTAGGQDSAHFSHNDESAHPGYYQVKLADDDINVELTATTRTGIHRYTFPQGKNATVLLDIDHSAKKGSWDRRIINAQIRLIDDHTIESFRVITGWAKLRKVYFHIEFSKPIVSFQLSDGNRMEKHATTINGSNLHGNFCFGTSDTTPLICKVAISPVSAGNARANMRQEAPHWDFDRYATDADIDYTTHSLPAGQTQYTTFSLWDTFRAAHPLYTLIVPERVPDMVNSMIRQQHSYGYLPIWQLWGQENYCMIGNHAIPVVVDAVLKGFKGINAEEAYEAVLASATTPHPNSPLDVWERYGYMPEDVQTQSVSVTLEQAFDDWCACQLAKRLGKTADADRFAKRALFYKNLYNSVSHFFQPKNSKGEWMQPFDPYKYGANGGYAFTEGNAWQYYWYVPHNIDSLVALTGGKKAFANKLDQFFTDTLEIGERKSPRDIYIKSARLNGHPLKKLSITHRQITDGGTLVFTMKGKP